MVRRLTTFLLFVFRLFVPPPFNYVHHTITAYARSVPFVANPGTATYVYASGDLSFPDMLKKGNCSDATECLLTFRALDQTGKELSSNYLLLTPFYDVTTMQRPKLTITNITEHPQGTAGAR